MPPPLALAFDAKRAFDNRTGLGNYARTLLSSLSEHQPSLFLGLYAPRLPRFAEARAWAATMAAHPQVRTVIGPARGGALWRTFGMGPRAAADGAQLFHGLSGELPRRLPARVKAIVTVHDLIFWRYPHLFPALDRFFYRQKLLHACHRADAVVCISEATRAELLDLVPDDLAGKTTVIYQSVEARTPPPPLAEPRLTGPARLLYVGALTERKNVATVLRALRGLEDVDYQFDILGAGPEGPALAGLIAADSRMTQRVRLRGHVTDTELASALADATALVYPSTAEGFGIPILEALLAGLSVIASDTSSLLEAGGDAARYCPPTDEAAWTAALRAVLTNPAERERMRARGYAHAERFASARIAAQWRQLYAHVAGSNSAGGPEGATVR